MRQLVLLGCLLLFACTPQIKQTESSSTLVPYVTVTNGATPETPNGLILSAETPFPTPTPFTYAVQSGDTLSQIAEKYHVSLDELLLANPKVSPNSMPIGTVLLIPSNPANPTGASTPTPVPALVKQINCYPTNDRGMWCFALIHNDYPAPMENVSAQVTLQDSNNAAIATQTASLPLNILPPNTSLPLYVFFQPIIPITARPQVQIISSFLLTANDPRYLPATISNTSVQKDGSAHNAQVGGQVNLPAGSKAASVVWVAAVAYDKDGQVVGVKRWEGGGIQLGGSLPFNFMVASAGPAIETVEFAVEAR